MVTTGLIVRLEARAGKEDAVAEFLRSAVPLVEGEPQTIAWFAVRLGAVVIRDRRRLPRRQRPPGAPGGARRGGAHGERG